MADGVAITAGLGTTVATDDAGAAGHVQLFKLAISTDGSATLVPADAANGIDVDVTRVQGTVTVADATGNTHLSNILAAVDQLEGYTDTLEALLGSASATASAAGTGSAQIVAGAGKLVSFSARETTGSAAAVFRLRDGSGGTILATVSLLASESVRDTFMGGITYSTSLYLERVSGTTEVTVATR